MFSYTLRKALSQSSQKEVLPIEDINDCFCVLDSEIPHNRKILIPDTVNDGCFWTASVNGGCLWITTVNGGC